MFNVPPSRRRSWGHLLRLFFSFLLFTRAEALLSPGNLVSVLNQYFALIIIGVAFAFMWAYKNRIIFLLTGDDRLHGNSLDVCWFCCRKGFDMFPNSCYLFGLNLKKRVGQGTGLLSTPLRLVNLRVGDLPFSGRGDFYLTVECGDHPPITTSVVEDSDPKVVHFLEPINIRLRDNYLENKVIFTVKEEDVFGSKSLCQFSIEAKQVFDILRNERSRTGEQYVLKRFAMDNLQKDWIPETPPWIIMEITTEMDSSLKEIDNPANRGMTALMTHQGVISGMAIYEKHDVKELKQRYRLIDNQGRVVVEPDEGDLEGLRAFKKSENRKEKLFLFTILLLMVSYGLFRFYTWSCYRQFKNITIGEIKGEKFPISPDGFSRIRHLCKGKIIETHPECFPSKERVLETCVNVPAEQPRPKAFATLWYDLFGWRACHMTLPCFGGVCAVRNNLDANDFNAVILCFVLCVLYLCYRDRIQNKIRTMNKDMAEQMATRISGGARSTVRMPRDNAPEQQSLLLDNRSTYGQVPQYDTQSGLNQGYF